jgi:hypothetical protein
MGGLPRDLRALPRYSADPATATATGDGAPLTANVRRSVDVVGAPPCLDVPPCSLGALLDFTPPSIWRPARASKKASHQHKPYAVCKHGRHRAGRHLRTPEQANYVLRRYVHILKPETENKSIPRKSTQDPNKIQSALSRQRYAPPSHVVRVSEKASRNILLNQDTTTSTANMEAR